MGVTDYFFCRPFVGEPTLTVRTAGNNIKINIGKSFGYLSDGKFGTANTWQIRGGKYENS